MALVELNNISLTFRVRQHARTTLKELFVQRFSRRASDNPLTRVEALKCVDFKATEGDRLGILGHNGAGKSTLLKVLAGIYPPTSGKRTVRGQISSLFDISLGFEQEATGWENIGYRSYLQGETPRSIKDKIAPIAEFSELGRFLDMPVRCYSAGMRVRLAFAIATAIEPEILLVDEVLSVGDMAFQEKARERMYEMMAKAKIIVMVSHDLGSMKALCDRIVWLDHGTVRQVGQPDEVIAAYIDHVHHVEAVRKSEKAAA